MKTLNKVAFIFPGQGSQHTGMGKDFFHNFEEARQVFEATDSILSMKLSELCFGDDEEEIKKTENAQPLIYTTSMAILKVIEKYNIKADYTACLNLGEYTALTYGGALKFQDCIKILRKRGELMENEVPKGSGTMAAILGLDSEKIDEMIEKGRNYGQVEVANYNTKGQIVISGQLEAVKKTNEIALELGAKKAIELNVSGPFHSSLLKGASEKLGKYLEEFQIYDLDKKMISNVDAKFIEDKDQIKDKLTRQVSSSVLWEQSMEALLDEGVDTFVEIGPGKSLTGFIKKIAKENKKEIMSLNVNNMESLNKTIEILGGK